MNLYTKIYLILLVLTLIIHAYRVAERRGHEVSITLLMIAWLIGFSGMLNYLSRHSLEMALETYPTGYIFKYLLFVLFIAGAFCTAEKAPVEP